MQIFVQTRYSFVKKNLVRKKQKEAKFLKVKKFQLVKKL